MSASCATLCTDNLVWLLNSSYPRFWLMYRYYNMTNGSFANLRHIRYIKYISLAGVLNRNYFFIVLFSRHSFEASVVTSFFLYLVFQFHLKCVTDRFEQKVLNNVRVVTKKILLNLMFSHFVWDFGDVNMGPKIVIESFYIIFILSNLETHIVSN